MKRHALHSLAVVLLLALAWVGCGTDKKSTAPSGGTTFSAVIAGGQEVPAVTTTASGTGSFTLNAAKTELSFKITVNGLSAISAAHFHNGAAGVSAGVVRGFSASEITSAGTDAWSVTGTWSSTDTQPLTSALVQELEAGNIYVNFHTTAYGSGEIRGQLKPQ